MLSCDFEIHDYHIGKPQDERSSSTSSFQQQSAQAFMIGPGRDYASLYASFGLMSQPTRGNVHMATDIAQQQD
jgi:hypothetical protein